MSMIRRINACARYKASQDTARNAGDIAEVMRLQKRIEKLMPRGADYASETANIINLNHWDAHNLLQAKSVGVPVQVAYFMKSAKHAHDIVHTTYVRKGYRANISRRWVPVDAYI